jgi:hypothetical protein
MENQNLDLSKGNALEEPNEVYWKQKAFASSRYSKKNKGFYKSVLLKYFINLLYKKK